MLKIQSYIQHLLEASYHSFNFLLTVLKKKKKKTEENTGKNENCTLGNAGSNLNQNKIALDPKLLSASQLSSVQQNCYLVTEGSFKCPRHHCKLISAS